MFSEKDLSQLISDVEKEFSSYLAKAESEETILAKAEGEPKDKEEDKEEEKPEAHAEEEQEETPEEEISEEVPEMEENPEQEEQEVPEQEEQGHGYDEEDMAHMQEMYASMSREELIAHHDAIRAALDACSPDQQEPEMAPEQSAPEQEAPPMMHKSEETTLEVKPEIVQTSEATEMLKSEVAAKTAEVEKLQKTLDAVTAFVTKLVEKKAAPSGKAITHLETIAKSESTVEEKPLSKQEITATLSEKASDSKLSKSDREAINQYYATGQININAISHLLKKNAG